jgi:hypothetical protein
MANFMAGVATPPVNVIATARAARADYARVLLERQRRTRERESSNQQGLESCRVKKAPDQPASAGGTRDADETRSRSRIVSPSCRPNTEEQPTGFDPEQPRERRTELVDVRCNECHDVAGTLARAGHLLERTEVVPDDETSSPNEPDCLTRIAGDDISRMAAVDEGRIEANAKDGVLYLKVPKRPEVQPRAIEVNVK